MTLGLSRPERALVALRIRFAYEQEVDGTVLSHAIYEWLRSGLVNRLSIKNKGRYNL